MKNLEMHPLRNLKAPTDAQLDALSAKKQQRVLRDQYVCPLCQQIPDKIKPVVENGNPTELLRLLAEHIAKHLKSLSLVSLPCLEIAPADRNARSITFGYSDHFPLRSESSRRQSSGIEYVQMDVDIDTISREMYDPEYYDYSPLELPDSSMNIDWNLVTNKYQEAREGRSDMAPIHGIIPG